MGPPSRLGNGAPWAYGFRFAGSLVASGPFLSDPGSDSPCLRVCHAPGEPSVGRAEIGPDRATIPMPPADATLVLGRRAATITIQSLQPPTLDVVVHPCLWPAAAVFARWHGWETFHGGAFLDDSGRAWAVLGDSGSGKSTLLGALAAAGRPIVADDLLVLRSGTCCAGPRCIDIHPDAAEALGVSERTTPVRATLRRRLTLDGVKPVSELRGLVYLAWGERAAIRRLSVSERVGRLGAQRRVTAIGVDAEAVLRLAALPALELQRPRDATAVTASMRLLIDRCA
jgi:hypothetical protein